VNIEQRIAHLEHRVSELEKKGTIRILAPEIKITVSDLDPNQVAQKLVRQLGRRTKENSLIW
jgi:hypothetical protein